MNNCGRVVTVNKTVKTLAEVFVALVILVAVVDTVNTQYKPYAEVQTQHGINR